MSTRLDTARLGSMKPQKGTFAHVVTKPKSHPLAELHRQYPIYREALEKVARSESIVPEDLKELQKAGNSLAHTIETIERRGNVLLEMALTEVGMTSYKGKWKIQITREPKRLMIDSALGRIPFIIIHDQKHK